MNRFFLLILLISFFSCDESDTEEKPNRQTVTISLQNSTGATGCAGSLQITFIISYRDIQVDADINPGSFGVINALVEDGESINVQVRDTETNDIIGDKNFDIGFADSGKGRVTYCRAFSLSYSN